MLKITVSGQNNCITMSLFMQPNTEGTQKNHLTERAL